MMKNLFLLSALAGLAVPYYFLISFFIQNGFQLDLLLIQIFQTPGSTFFAVDVIISAIVLIIYILAENKKAAIQYSWIAITGTLLVGVSFGLPLFLFFKELSSSKQ